MNVHMLSHVVNCVANWGPLWCYSCFPFEGMNGTFKSFFHGTRNMNEQVNYNLWLYMYTTSYEMVAIFIQSYSFADGILLHDDAGITRN